MASHLSSFEKFCGNSAFWNYTLIRYSSYPEFTECFKHVALQWIPCMLFLVSAVPYVYHVWRQEYNLTKIGFLCIAKMCCAISLLGISIGTLIVRATDNDQDSIPDALYVSEGLKIACFLTTTVVIHLERLKGYVRSPLLWFFYLGLVVCSIVPFYSNLEEDLDDDDEFGFVIFYVYFGFILLLFLLTSCAEKRNMMHKDIVSEHGTSSPELTASMPSIMLFLWFNSLIYRGYKKSLKEEDVFDLHPKDQCKMHTPKFERLWAKEEENVKKYNAKIKLRYPQEDINPAKSSLSKKLDEKTPLIPAEKKTKDEKSKVKSPFKSVSLLWVLTKSFGPIFIISQLLRTGCELLQFLTPKLTEFILQYISYRSTYHEWQGYCLAASFGVILTVSSIGSNFANYVARRIGINIKGVLMNAIYKKSLTISRMDDEFTSGEVVNLMAIDCQRIEEMAPFVYFFVAAPFQIGLSIYMLYDKMHEATFAGMGVMVLVFPINVLIGLILRRNQIAQMKYKDDRMRMTTEVLNGIKVLKLYAWEESFQDKITATRENELKVVQSTQMAVSVIFYIMGSIPSLVQLTSFAVYIAISDEGYLSPIVASVSLQLFALLNFPLTIIPIIFPLIVQLIVSINRISNYLGREDIDPTIVNHDPSSENAIDIKEGKFTWNHNLQPALRDINVAIKPGSLVAVVGMVGSGKSSLLSAILGEMFKIKGSVTLKDTVAYVPQEAWIQNATVKDNILFGSPFDRKRYDRIIMACALKSDLDILPGGDKTEIGEKGINISGGQKQRVSLARAVYSDNEIYLLDDPLSAVDSHVGKHIFKQVISSNGLLKNKTRVLVTHGIHWLPMVDNIIVMADGKISETGTYDELMSEDGAFAQFLKDNIQGTIESDNEEQTDPEVEAMKRTVLKRLGSVSGGTSGEEWQSRGTERKSKKQKTSPKQTQSRRSSIRRPSVSALEVSLMGLSVDEQKGTPSLVAGQKLVEEEKEGSGKVKWETYVYFLKAVGLKTTFIGFFLYLCSAGVKFFTGVWLSEWTSDDLLLNTSRSDEDDYDETTIRYLVVYGVAGIVRGLFIFAFALIAAIKLTNAAGILHKRMLVNILRLPMSFFDTNPIGRILNRFSRDVDVLDNILPQVTRQVLDGMSQIVATILTISYGTPIFLVIVVPLAIINAIVMGLFIPTIRQLRRLDSVSRSPVFSHFSETISGVSSIRAYRCQDRFLKESTKRVDHNFKFYFPSVISQNWVNLYLQLLANIVVFAAALFAVSSTDTDAGIAGVSISYATQMTVALRILMEGISLLESNIVSVERIKEYSVVEQEAAWVNPCHRPNPDWPHEGEMQFQNYQTRYRPGLDLVLKDISCHIKGGEKIGIVGRTGAGKSSMTVALFRIIEAVAGQIIIDSENISSLGLHDLRKKLTILPQEPVIFCGSLRMNLDPVEESSDMAIWDALERCYMKDFVQGLPEGLEYECGEGGSNLSVGQRQLICLGRTLLRKTKILVLDEATAAVDMETDQLIQKTIKEEFKDSTVLTIAHRLNTIMDYDRVMVLDKGNISEFDTPSRLLSDSTTIFYSMAKNAGLISS